MKQGTGELTELYLEHGQTGARLRCVQNLIPAPGQYLLTHDPASDAPLPAPIFNAGTVPGGFLAAPPIPSAWMPGTTLNIRGPLGNGFSMPASARRVALAALGETPARLNSLLDAALTQAAVVLLTDSDITDLPTDVEVQPLLALTEVVAWADYLAVDVERESLPKLWTLLGGWEQARALKEAQALIVTPVPCGCMADCGVCTVNVRHGWKMTCKDGPVFDLRDLE